MAPPDPPAITFLDDEGNELSPADLAADAAIARRRAALERWLPDGGGAAIAGLVFVLVAWLGSAPIAQAVGTLFPESDQIFPPTGSGTFGGGGGYYGISPDTVVVVSFGTRAAIALVALVLGLRARHAERSALSGACVVTAAGSFALFVLAAVVMIIGLAQGHQGNFYGVF